MGETKSSLAVSSIGSNSPAHRPRICRFSSQAASVPLSLLPGQINLLPGAPLSTVTARRYSDQQEMSSQVARLVPFFWPINCWLFGAIEAGQMIACVSNLRMAEIPKELSRMRRRPRRLRELDGTARNARRRLEVELFRPELRSVNLRLPPELLQQVDDERRVCDLWGHSVAVRAAQDDDRRGFGFSPGGSDAAAARQRGAVPDFARRLAGRISRAGLIPPIWPVMDTSTDVDVSRKVGNHALRHCLYACEHR